MPDLLACQAKSAAMSGRGWSQGDAPAQMLSIEHRYYPDQAEPPLSHRRVFHVSLRLSGIVAPTLRMEPDMPTYPPAHKRIQFQGTLIQAAGAGSEIFDFGFADLSGLSLEAIATSALGRMQTAWTQPNNDVSNLARLDGVRVESVDAAGKVDGSFYMGGTQPVGAATGANCTVLSMCLTLETTTDTGSGRFVRGRFYPPAYPSIAGATSPADAANQYAGSWASVLNGMYQDGIRPGVASTTGGGQLAPVTSLTAANVIDTVRRRRNHVTVTRGQKWPIAT